MILYVNEITETPSSGFAETPEVIYHNLRIIDPDLLNDLNNTLGELNQLTYTKNAGRYVAIITVSLDESKMNMLFIDFNKDISFAKRLGDKIGNQDMAIQAFNDNIKNYDSDKDKFTLEVWKGDKLN